MAGSPPKQERSERTRAHIIQTAASAFAEHGFDGVSLNNLVTASGLSKGAFYFHFSSKEEIALAAFRAKQQEMLTLLAANRLRRRQRIDSCSVSASAPNWCERIPRLDASPGSD